MNSTPSRPSLVASAVAILGAFLIMAALVALLRHYFQPAGVDQARVAERRKALAEARQAALQLETYSVIDPGKAQYQLRIGRAMEMVIQGWQNAAAGRSNLLARVDKFNAPPPPQAPAPSQFE